MGLNCWHLAYRMVKLRKGTTCYFSASKLKMNKQQLMGFQGEQSARAYLEARGFCFVCANYRSRWGEIDLIMQEENCLVFVEVKTRRSGKYGTALEAITAQKQRKLWMTARDYLLKKPFEGPVRFDVVGIDRSSDQEQIQHICNALEAV